MAGLRITDLSTLLRIQAQTFYTTAIRQISVASLKQQTVFENKGIHVLEAIHGDGNILAGACVVFRGHTRNREVVATRSEVVGGVVEVLSAGGHESARPRGVAGSEGMEAPLQEVGISARHGKRMLEENSLGAFGEVGEGNELERLVDLIDVDLHESSELQAVCFELAELLVLDAADDDVQDILFRRLSGDANRTVEGNLEVPAPSSDRRSFAEPLDAPWSALIGVEPNTTRETRFEADRRCCLSINVVGDFDGF